jgi:aminopeptidase N
MSLDKLKQEKKLIYKLLPFILLVFFTTSAGSQERLQRHDSFDVHRYSINLEVNDTSNIINGVTGLEIILKKPVENIFLDLASVNNEGIGMSVDSVLKNGILIEHDHRNNILTLPVYNYDSLENLVYKVFYRGGVEDGLTISKSMYGERTFFAQNWPNRAHKWFPCIDHPSFRSKVNFTITAPAHYQVIATGNLVKRINLPGKRTSHYWSSDIPIPTKVMVFAAAGFAVEYPGDIDGIPWSNWVYPQNMEKGFSAFSGTPDILRFFSDMIAPYPFEKIANVQGTTLYGGMENAGNIFYHERSVAGDSSIEKLIVHEMAHQWFGNSLSEKDWPHIWLSEGIATWLTDWYVKQIYDSIKYRERLASHREKIIEYSRERLAPVVDHHTDSYTGLLNPNSYQKGSWVLHMLRRKIGDEMVVRGLREFYDRYKSGYAGTEDFIRVLEELTGTDLGQFADDWLYSAGHPVLSVKSQYSNGRLTMELIQMQQHKMAFTFPLDIRFILEDGNSKDQTFNIIFRRHEFIIELPSEPADIILDPYLWLLFELN